MAKVFQESAAYVLIDFSSQLAPYAALVVVPCCCFSKKSALCLSSCRGPFSGHTSLFVKYDPSVLLRVVPLLLIEQQASAFKFHT
mmetsp:Transcript_11466/g.20292  ORF Transcript_11466/g.20292 Transcript_11466/m.20292 type:complete len:85 (+) Transcript_11466:1366-1620(+)